MMIGHTPGPWTWNEDRPKKYDLCLLRGPNGEHILDLYGNGEITPDKALIAAAPDLLEAARLAHHALLERIPGSVPGGEEVCEALRVAIQKAAPIPPAPKVHSGWCSVSPRDKIGLGVSSATEAYAKCEAWGLEIFDYNK